MAGAGTSYQQLLDAVESYYGSGSDQWVEVAKYGLKADNMAEILRQVPGVQAHLNKAGNVVGYTISETVPLNDGGLSLPAINSNVQTGVAAPVNTTQIQTLGNFTTDVQTGNVSSTMQIPKKTGGVAGTAVATIGAVASTVLAAGAGLKFGRWVNNKIYDNNPDFWANLTDIPEGSEAQEEWAKITALYDEVDKDGKVTHFLNVIAGLDGKESTIYMDENAMAYYAWQLEKAGYFELGRDAIPENVTELTGVLPGIIQAGGEVPWDTATNVMGQNLVNWAMLPTTKSFANGEWSSGSGGQYQSTNVLFASASRPASGSFASYFTYDNKTVYYFQTIKGTDNMYLRTLYPYIIKNPGNGAYPSLQHQAWYMIYGQLTTSGSMDGVETDPNATLPNTTGWDTPADTLASLKNQYPSWWDDAYENEVVDENGDSKTVYYIPVPLPANYNNGNPITQDNPSTQQNPAVDPDNPSVTDDLLRTIIAILSKPAVDPATITDPKTDDPTGNETNPPDTGGGVTPPLVVPVGSASALWAVYNPTQAQIDSLGAWLWSNNFVDQLLKMFNDPMQAIIGLHKTFIPPITGGVQDIKVGYLNSGVSSLTVPVQYSSVDCGTIDCAEYFGNVFDYSPYTRIYLYLPFIGFKELEVAQVMRSRINVTYHGDAFTGTCLAEVAVNRDGESGGVLYTYSGDCAARYPLSHGSYMGIVSGVVGVATSTAMALGGMVNPIMGLGGIVGSAMGARNKVEHSGGFSGNSGAMGIKRPYLVIMRPQTAMARNYEHFTGQPSNSNVVLGSATGYVRVKECHVEDIATATDAEKQMIESALKTGVII